MNKHIARKRFGQHFLCDQNIIQRIVSTINPRENEVVVEIGPGQGAITLPLLQSTKQLHVIELDRDLIPILKKRCAGFGDLYIHQADVLHFDFKSLGFEKIKVVGNLPYNISTPLIFYLLEQAHLISDMIFMLQKEVVDRLCAHVGSKNYGRLSIMVQYHCEVTSLFDVPPDAFDPPPQVNSSVVKLVPYPQIPFVAHDFTHFSTLVKTAFNQRRKTLRNALKNLVENDAWQAAGIDSVLRPEQLSVQQYVHLSNTITRK